MAKIKDDAGLMSLVEQRLDQLKSVISDMDEKRGKLFLLWLQQQNNYLQWELTFDPKFLKRYKRGEVVHFHFGFNTGSEHGGPHWGVILDDNKKSSPTALVMPLGSLDEDQEESNVHIDDVYLGKIPSINDKLVYGIPNQIRALSKVRIIKPKKVAHQSYSLNNDQLDAIDKKIFEMLFSKSKKIHELSASYLEAAKEAATSTEDESVPITNGNTETEISI